MDMLKERLNEKQFVECLLKHVPFYLSYLIEYHSRHGHDDQLNCTPLRELCELCFLPNLIDDDLLDIEEKYYCLSLAVIANKTRIQEFYEIVA